MRAGTCPSCGSAVQPGAEFCTVCGARLAGLGQASSYQAGASGMPPPPPPPPVGVPPGPSTAPTQPLPASSAYQPPSGALWPPSAPAYTPPPGEQPRRVVGLRPVAMAGAIAAAVSAFLPWVRFDFHVTAFKVPLKFLFQAEAGSTSANAGLVLVAAAVVGFLLSLFPAVSLLRRLVGLVVVAVPVAFVVQALRFSDAHVFSNLGAGLYVAAVGGFLLMLG